MKARIRSMFGWLRGLGKAQAQASPRKRPSRIPSACESLERREVLTSASLFPWVTLANQYATVAIPATATVTTPVVAASIVTAATPVVSASPYVAQLSPQVAASAVATPAVYYYGQPVVQAPTIPTVSTLSVAVPVTQPVLPGPLAASSATDPASQYIESLYHDVLGRAGNATEVASWLTRMNSGMTPAGVAANFVNSPEHRQDQVDYDYETLLHRTPDPNAALWVDALLMGASEQSVESAILDSPEYQATHADPAQFVQGLYNGVLARQGSAAEVAGWLGVMEAGESRPAVVASFVNSNEAVDEAINGFYTDYLHRQPDAGGVTAWAGVLKSPLGSLSQMEVGILSSPDYVLRASKA